MRRIAHLMVVATCALGFGSTAAAQSQPQGGETAEPRIHEVIELTRSVVQTQRKAIVANAMQLTEQESQAFWPVYRAYHAEIDLLNDRLAALITDYLKDTVNVSQGEAEEMLDEYLSIRAERIKLKQKHVKRFQKVLPSIKAVRYYQVENKLDAAVDLELAKSIPLIW